MKLINKFTIWYLCIVLTCTLIGTYITYYNVKNELDTGASQRLIAINNAVADKLTKGIPAGAFMDGREFRVLPVSAPASEAPVITERSVPVTGMKQNECRMSVTSFHKINNSYYSITSSDYIVKGQQIFSGMKSSIFWKWLLILFLIAISARLASRIILGPFNKTLKVMGAFSLRQKEKIRLPHTSTKEFRELNTFVQTMTDRAEEDYSALKEFTENASHELQTPVAVIRGKVELLAESDMNPQQAELIADIQDSLERLSRINSSLILLARLENHEYQTNRPLRFCRVINESLASYKELIDLKSLTLTKEVEKRVWVKLHPDLAHLLLTNLFSNAIRHNNGEGKIEVSLTQGLLTIKNTGCCPERPIEELFHRFQKGNQFSQSIGIGLAIVKQICDLNNIAVNYTFNDGWHTLQLSFSSIHELSGIQEDEETIIHPMPSLQL